MKHIDDDTDDIDRAIRTSSPIDPVVANLERVLKLPAHFRSCPAIASEVMSKGRYRELVCDGGVYEIDGCWYQIWGMPLTINTYRVRLKGI